MVATEAKRWAELLANTSDEVAALARALHAAALIALSDLTERVRARWFGPGLRHPQAGLTATIIFGEQGIAVYSERGTSLPDADGIFEDAERLCRTG